MPRVKTYSSQTGFAYQYQFLSHEASAHAERYHFSATQNRQTAIQITIALPHPALRSWEEAATRSLTPTERYAIAKMALFGQFDIAASPEELQQPFSVDAAQVRDIVEALDL